MLDNGYPEPLLLMFGLGWGFAFTGTAGLIHSEKRMMVTFAGLVSLKVVG